MNRPDYLQFGVDSQLIGELGERLVTNNYIALAELIKNSYDADSTFAEISLINLRKGSKGPGSSKIIVKDHGVGMTFDQVNSQWMRIATANKLENPDSIKFGRPKTGNKGIGRFACQRLAKNLILTTTAKNGAFYETTTVLFKWRKFVTGTELTEIDCDYTTTKKKSGETGTVLKLIGLRDLWTERDFNMLQKNIALLSLSGKTQRNGYEFDTGFETRLIANQFEKEPFDLQQKYLTAGWGSMTGSIGGNGKLVLALNSKNSEKKKYQTAESFPLIKGVKFTIHFMPANKDGIDSRRNASILTNHIRDQLIEIHSGVRIYLDGFRVNPYGSKNDDWLELTKDVSRRLAAVENDGLKQLAKELNLNPSRALLKLPAYRNTIGNITLGNQKESSFVVKMDREGLVENDAYFELKKAVRLSIDWLTLHYDAFITKERADQYESSVTVFKESFGLKEGDSKNEITEAIKFLKSSAEISHDTAEFLDQNKSNVKSLASDSEKKLSNVNIAVDLISKRINEADAELMLLRSVASTGPLMFVFAHEVKGITNSLPTHALYLKSISKKISDKVVSKELLTLADNFTATKSRFDQLSQLFNVFSSSNKLDEKAIPIHKVIEQIVNGFGFILSEFAIQVDYSSIGRTLTSPLMKEAEFYTVIVNLLSNAVKSVMASNGNKIKIEADKANGNIKISFLDNGVGLPKKYRKDVFNPLFSDPENKIYQKLDSALHDSELSSLGRGSGLGLNIVKSIIDLKKGTINFIDPPANWKACVILELPLGKNKT